MSTVAVLVRGLYQQIGVTTAGLVPVLDIINHSSTTSVSPASSSAALSPWHRLMCGVVLNHAATCAMLCCLVMCMSRHNVVPHTLTLHSWPAETICMSCTHDAAFTTSSHSSHTDCPSYCQVSHGIWLDLQSTIQQTWLSNRLEAVIGQQVQAGHEVALHLIYVFHCLLTIHDDDCFPESTNQGALGPYCCCLRLCARQIRCFAVAHVHHLLLTGMSATICHLSCSTCLHAFLLWK